MQVQLCLTWRVKYSDKDQENVQNTAETNVYSNLLKVLTIEEYFGKHVKTFTKSGTLNTLK